MLVYQRVTINIHKPIEFSQGTAWLMKFRASSVGKPQTAGVGDLLGISLKFKDLALTNLQISDGDVASG